MDDKYQYIVNRSKDFITLIDRGYVYTVVNDSYCDAIGLPKAEILNRTVADVWGEEKFSTTLKGYIDRCFDGEEIHYIEKFKFGIYLRYMHVSYYPFFDDDEENISYVCVYSHDITKLGQIESKLNNYEYRDPITGLYNRKSLEMILESELEKARRFVYEKLRAVLYIGIENLTEINRKHGHTVGNILLENTGLKIREVLRNSDCVFRYEGNELIILLSNLAQHTDAAKVARKVHEEITTPYNYQDFTITFRAHIGISLFPDDGDNQEDLLQNAIDALEEARSSGQPYLLYDRTIHEKAQKKLDLERELYVAFQQGQFHLYYQPIVNMQQHIVGAEALIRWEHPRYGMITPITFLPLAEEIGLVKEIGKWALFTSTKQLEEWRKNHDIYISINISAPEFENTELLEIVQAVLRQAPSLSPNCLKLELTESEEMIYPELSIQKMREFCNLGIDILIDDFGTGRASLSYLKNIPAKTLKIDKVFVDEIVSDPQERHFLEHIINLVKSREKQVIIEGIGTKEQFSLIKEMNCDYMQGFYFSTPLSAGAFTSVLDKHTKLPIYS